MSLSFGLQEKCAQLVFNVTKLLDLHWSLVIARIEFKDSSRSRHKRGPFNATLQNASAANSVSSQLKWLLLWGLHRRICKAMIILHRSKNVDVPMSFNIQMKVDLFM